MLFRVSIKELEGPADPYGLESWEKRMTTAQALASLMSAILKCLKAVGRATAAAVLTNNPSKVWNELGPGFFQAGPAAWLEMSTAAAQLRQDREPASSLRATQEMDSQVCRRQNTTESRKYF